MALMIRVTRLGYQLRIYGVWESKLPLFQNFTLKVKDGETSAETVELAMMEQGYVASWLWSEETVYGEPILRGQFAREGSHKEVSNSLAHLYDLPLRHAGEENAHNPAKG